MVSVIMPVYNVDRFIMRAVESLQRQTFEDFELIAVDDGSTDRSGDILDSLATRDIRIEVMHIPNGGAAAARNLALDRARGTYVYFMDADDWCDEHMLEDMVEAMQRDDLELLVCGFYIDTFFGDGPEHSTEVKSYPTQTFATQQDFRLNAYQLFDRNLLYTPWNKLFLRSRIEDLHIRFRNTFMDDFPFVLDYIRDVERVGVLEQAYYHFTRARSESETSRWRPDLYEKREEEHTWMLDLYKHWELDGDPASMEMVQRRYIERLVGCIENVCDPACELPGKEKVALISDMISSDRAQVAVEVAQPRTQMMRMMLAPIRGKDANLAYSEGCLISFVRRHNTRIFSTLKANR
jgi:glycosyltransferase involved in cell wall biosynthesis